MGGPTGWTCGPFNRFGLTTSPARVARFRPWHHARDVTLLPCAAYVPPSLACTMVHDASALTIDSDLRRSTVSKLLFSLWKLKGLSIILSYTSICKLSCHVSIQAIRRSSSVFYQQQCIPCDQSCLCSTHIYVLLSNHVRMVPMCRSDS